MQQTPNRQEEDLPVTESYQHSQVRKHPCSVFVIYDCRDDETAPQRFMEDWRAWGNQAKRHYIADHRLTLEIHAGVGGYA